MPTQKERHATVLKKLQDSVQHEDPTVAAERLLYIERWVKTYIKQVEYLQDNKLEFLRKVFQDESCWSGVRLNNTVLGQKFAQDEIDGIENPLYKYDMACRYCITDRIPPLFQKKFTFYKGSFRPDTVDNSGNPMADEYMRIRLLNCMERQDPILVFWINKENPEELKQHDNPAEGFDMAVKLKWSEGVEYFYNHLKEEDKKEKLTETIISLSAIQCTQNQADILDFCISKMDDNENSLLKELSQKDRCVYSLFSRLLFRDFYSTVGRLVGKWFCREEIPVAADKVLSYKDYAQFLSSLSEKILIDPEFALEGRKIVMDLWKSPRFIEHKKGAVKVSGNALPIKGALAGLIVNWKRKDCCGHDGEEEREKEKKEEILDIMLFAKDCFPERFKSFKERIIINLKIVGRQGMEKGVNYCRLAEDLFSELEERHLSASHSGSGIHQEADIEIVECENDLDTSSIDTPRSMLDAPSTSSGFSSLSK